MKHLVDVQNIFTIPMCHTIYLLSKNKFIILDNIICDRAYENRPCERKLHQVIFSLISFVPNAPSHFRKWQKKAH